jgi:DNA repair photolyase
MARHGSDFNPHNRFTTIQRQADWEQLEQQEQIELSHLEQPIEFIPDDSQSIVSQNDSPDIPFRYSLNPYRGCIHGCAYCYARPTHEYLGFSAGLDFETKIIFKPQAATLFRNFLSRPGWQCQPIIFSGVTDCYQPAERKFGLTRDCLQVAYDFRQPVGVITKNALVLRDLQLLKQMAQQRLVHVAISLTTLSPDLARDMEPRTSTPAARLRAIHDLSSNGIPVQVMVAPIIPGLNDSSLPQVLQAAREAGATTAGYQVVRLPLTVLPVFQRWLERTQPLKAAAVLELIRSTRDGQLNDAQFGSRMSGQGTMAKQIGDLFRVFVRKLKLSDTLPERDCSQFQVPPANSGQLMLF